MFLVNYIHIYISDKFWIFRNGTGVVITFDVIQAPINFSWFPWAVMNSRSKEAVTEFLHTMLSNKYLNLPTLIHTHTKRQFCICNKTSTARLVIATYMYIIDGILSFICFNCDVVFVCCWHKSRKHYLDITYPNKLVLPIRSEHSVLSIGNSGMTPR